MNKFKLVILDYAKLQLENPVAQRALNDLIIAKQKNYERTDPNFVCIDKHDMIGTHFMIYETSNPYAPKLITALRATYEDRAQLHKLRTPLQDLMPNLDEKGQAAYTDYHDRKKIIADCNAWFVDPDFSLKGSGLRLSDVGYAMVYLHVTRMGFDHIAGATNEKYRASRWLENIGTFEKGHMFPHPVLPGPHMMILIEKFNLPYIKSIYESHQAMFDELFELTPKEMKYDTIAETITNQFKESATVQNLQDWSRKKAG